MRYLQDGVDLRSSPEPLAIIGMACRLPGADSLSAFWKQTTAGVDAVTPLPEARRPFANLQGSPPAGYLSQVDTFDAKLFAISPREAEAMDPQQRMLLEETWRALEDAHLSPESLKGSPTGIFLGISHNDYSHVVPATSDPYMGTGNALSIAANRLSYFFDLRGPSLSIDTACSSSLAAVHLAAQSLALGESELAICLGSNLILSDLVDRHLRAGGFFSPEGRCKTFDSRADGYVRGEGVVAVVLMPLSRAVKEGHRIYACLLGSAQGNDGSTNGLTAPNQKSQEAVIARALRKAAVDPWSVQYVETHGTGTKLGDPIEVAALGQVLQRSDTSERLWLGALKSQIGHLEAAAGIAALARAALALHHRVIPPNLHFQSPNPLIDLERHRFAIPTQATPWPEPEEESRRHAGVSSFGFGGANVHVVLAEALPARRPVVEPGRVKGAGKGPWILPLSAHTEGSLAQLLAAYVPFLKSLQTPFHSLCRTVALTRPHLKFRVTIEAMDSAEAATQIETLLAEGLSAEGRRLPVTFAFSDLGKDVPYSPHIAIREGLSRMESVPEVEAALAELNEVFDKVGEPSHPAAYELAHATFYQTLGVRPDRWIGKGAGANLAAFADGRLPLAEAWRQAIAGVLLPSEPPEEGVTFSLSEPLSLAPTLAAFYRAGQNIVWHTLYSDCLKLDLPGLPFARHSYWRGPSTAAAHSLLGEVKGSQRWVSHPTAPLMTVWQEHRFSGAPIFPATAFIEMALASTTERVTGLAFERALPLLGAERLELQTAYQDGVGRISSRTAGGEWISHVRWSTEVETQSDAEGDPLFSAMRSATQRPPDLTREAFYREVKRTGLDLGPPFQKVQGVWKLAEGTLARIATEGPVGLDLATRNALIMDACAQLAALAGADRDRPFLPVQLGRVERFRPLATEKSLWSFCRNTHWDEQGGRFDVFIYSAEGTLLARVTDLRFELVAAKREENGATYAIDWQPVESVASEAFTSPCLLLLDRKGLGNCLAERLPQAEKIKWGLSGWEKECEQKLEKLAQQNPGKTIHLLHLWSLDAAKDSFQSLSQEKLGRGHSAVRLIQLAEKLPGDIKIWFVTSGAQAVAGKQGLSALSGATLWGLGRTLWQENPERLAGLIDIDDSETVTEGAKRVWQTLTGSGAEPQVAFRGGRAFAPRLRRRPPSLTSLRLDPEGSYLITGGLGSLGLLAARELASLGAKHLTLVGRRGLPARETWSRVPASDPMAPVLRGIEALEAQGVVVEAIPLDIADMPSVKQVLLSHDRRWRGVLHLAGVLQDSVLSRLDDKMIDDVFRAKVLGAWCLHDCLKKEPLEFFVLYSSIASVLGAASQASYSAANAALDALAHHRVSQGLPALSLNWGPFADTGFAAGAGVTARLSRFGIDGFTPEEGGAILRHALRESGQLLAAKVDWERFSQIKTPLSRTMLSPLRAEENRPGKAVEIRRTYQGLAEAKARLEFLSGHVKSLLAAASGIADTHFDPSISLMDLGIDSLMGLELVVRIEESFGIKLPMNQIFASRTFAALVDLVDRTMQERLPTAPVVESAIKRLVWNSSGDRTFFCFHPGALDLDCYEPLALQFPPELRYLAIQIGDPEAEEGNQGPTVKDLTETAYQALKAEQPNGPYLLGGWSLGGIVATELARRLRKEGETIQKLILFDCPSPDLTPGRSSLLEKDKVTAFGRYLAARYHQEIPPVSDLISLLGQGLRLGIFRADTDLARLETLYRIYERGLTASVAKVAAHTFHPLAVDTILVRAKGNYGTRSDGFQDALPGWQRVFQSQLQVIDLATDHYNLFSPEHAAYLVSQLEAVVGLQRSA